MCCRCIARHAERIIPHKKKKQMETVPVHFSRFNMLKILRSLFMMPAVLLAAIALHGQPAASVPATGKQTFTYAIKDSALQLDYYSLQSLKREPAPCILFVFGGAFIGGHRDDTTYHRYFDTLINHGYKVASISYRLGL